MPGPCYFGYGYDAPGELEDANRRQREPVDPFLVAAWLRDMESASRPDNTEGATMPAADRGTP